VVNSNPQRVAEERSLAYHREVAALLARRPDLLDAARERVAAWLRDGNVARPYAEAWRDLLAGSPDQLATALVDPGQRSRDLRQVSPFAGALDPRTRWRIHAEVRARHSR
jgi:hypothetical protein